MRDLTLEDLRNETGLEFSSLVSERWREYEFSDHSVRIDNPVALNVNTKSGTHRVLDAQGVSHIIPPGWKHLSWKARDGHPHFAFTLSKPEQKNAQQFIVLAKNEGEYNAFLTDSGMNEKQAKFISTPRHLEAWHLDRHRVLILGGFYEREDRADMMAKLWSVFSN